MAYTVMERKPVSLTVRTMGLDMLLASTMKTSALIVMQVCTCSILHKYGVLGYCCCTELRLRCLNFINVIWKEQLFSALPVATLHQTLFNQLFAIKWTSRSNMHRFNFMDLLSFTLKNMTLCYLIRDLILVLFFVRGQSYLPEANKQFQYQISY